MSNAQVRHFQKWPLLGISGPAPEVAPFPASYQEELESLKAWINTRLTWLDSNMPGNCNTTNISELNPNTTVSVFPNPGIEKIQFSGLQKTTKIERVKIYDVSGRIIHDIIIEPNTDSFSVYFKNPGAYSYVFEGINGFVDSGKIIIVSQ